MSKPTQAQIRAEYSEHAATEARQFVHGAIRDWRERHRPDPEVVGPKGVFIEGKGTRVLHTVDEPCPVEAPRDDYEQTRLRWPVRQLTQRDPALKWAHTALGVWTLKSHGFDPHWLFDFWGKPPSLAQSLWAPYAQIRLLAVEPVDGFIDVHDVADAVPKPLDAFPCHEDDDDTQAHFARLCFKPDTLLVGHNGQVIPPTYLGFDSRSSNGGMPAWMRPCARFLTDANRVSRDHTPDSDAPPEYTLSDPEEDEFNDDRTNFASDNKGVPFGARYWLFTPWAVQPFPSLETAQAAAVKVLPEISTLSFLATTKPLVNAHLPAVPKDLFHEFACPVCRKHLDTHAGPYQEHYERVIDLWRTLKLLSVAAHQAAGLKPITDRVVPYKTIVAPPASTAPAPSKAAPKVKSPRKPKAPK